MPKLKDTEKKTLTIKVTPDVYARIQLARKAAREEGKFYNVSESVTEFLERDMKRVYKEIGRTPPEKGRSSAENQADLFKEEETPNKTLNKAPKKTSKKPVRSGSITPEQRKALEENSKVLEKEVKKDA